MLMGQHTSHEQWVPRLTWASVFVPVVGIWLAEAVHTVFIERTATHDEANLRWAAGMTMVGHASSCSSGSRRPRTVSGANTRPNDGAGND